MCVYVFNAGYLSDTDSHQITDVGITIHSTTDQYLNPHQSKNACDRSGKCYTSGTVERKEENRGMEAGLRDIRLFFFRNGRTVRETGGRDES